MFYRWGKLANVFWKIDLRCPTKKKVSVGNKN